MQHLFISFSNVINTLILNDLACNFKFFCQRTSDNINLLYIKFKEKFAKSNLKFLKHENFYINNYISN